MNARVLPTLGWIAISLVVVSFAVAGARLTWHLAGETGQAVALDIAPGAQRAATHAPDIGPILALAPFGTPATQAAPEPETRETTLGFVLHGVVRADPAGASIAFIAIPGKEVRAYGIGSPIGTSATLAEVMADRVVLSVGDGRETLSFPKEDERSGAAAVRARLPASVAGVAPGGAEAPDVVIDGYRRRIAANPKAVLDDLGVSVTPEGYRIGETPASGVRQAGLRPGDLIARVNGVDVGDVERDRKLFEQIAASGGARVEVLRDGRRIIMSFPLR